MIVNSFFKKEPIFIKLENISIGTILFGIIISTIFTAYYFDNLNNHSYQINSAPLQDAITIENFIESGKSNPIFILIIGLFLLIGSLLLFFSLHQSKKRAEYIAFTKTKALEEVLLFQKLIMDHIPDFIFVKDSDYKIVAGNNAFLNAYPKDIRHTIIGTTTVEQYDDAQAKKFLKNDADAFEKGMNETEEHITFPNGKNAILLTKKVRFENHKGEKFILGVSRDITDRKKAEEEILRSNDELERFAYITSHDLQEPLRMIINFTGLLNEDYSDKLDDDGQYYMRFIVDSAHRMQNLIIDLLEYSKAGTNETTNEIFSSKRKFNFALEHLTEAIEKNNAKIHLRGDFPDLDGNRIRFLRLVQNLIGNAIKYRDPARDPEIFITAEDKKTHWQFSIEDNGIGIKEEYLDNIFIIFKRLHNKENYSGTGIGLAVCKKIVHGFGGKIWAESETDRGSKFIFTYPKKKEE